uniref:Transmembrane protein 43 homolog n=1 Tax=Megaselia scalaris TaxID=36166 RepID=T1GZS0_MEGSC
MSLVEEIRSSWLILLFGCILYTGGMCVLFWNEGRAVHITLSLGEALEDTVTIDPYAEPEENAIYDNRIVHFTGPLLIGEPLTEPDYNIHIMAVKLKRRVQMFQWVEESVESNFGGSVSSEDNNERNYYYYQDWRDKLIDHRRFYIQTGHHNPDKFPVESQTQIADLVKIGQFEIGLESKKKIEEYTEFTSDTRPEEPEIKLHMGFYYHTNDVFNPEIGDLRILFSFAGMEGEVYTVVGKLHQNRLV